MPEAITIGDRFVLSSFDGNQTRLLGCEERGTSRVRTRLTLSLSRRIYRACNGLVNVRS